ncbi:hypothetical protein LCGC14_0699320 [marine sediment metagenome]|uniref:HTH cro/C1-type domain-containing protein n=1 Tax=marine sediment metagenome TaxID=412755 RepID=A0A0F9QIE1_9ZZZZ
MTLGQPTGEVADGDQAPLVRLRLLTYNLRLVEARKEKGFTQAQFAQLTGIHAGRIGEIELLKRIPTLEEAEEMASALDKPRGWLFPPDLVRLIDVPREAYLNRWQIKKLGWVPRALPSGPDVLPGRTTGLREKLMEVLDTLKPKERTVLIMRYDLDGGGSRTLEEVRRELGVTRQRIRRIEDHALRVLRHPSRTRRLKDFLE